MDYVGSHYKIHYIVVFIRILSILSLGSLPPTPPSLLFLAPKKKKKNTKCIRINNIAFFFLFALPVQIKHRSITASRPFPKIVKYFSASWPQSKVPDTRNEFLICSINPPPFFDNKLDKYYRKSFPARRPFLGSAFFKLALLLRKSQLTFEF